MPLNEKYRPDPRKWVCTCPHFHKSRFLICKHLVQSVHPVPALFFFEVKRNRTTPFWRHKQLIPLDDKPDTSVVEYEPSPSMSDDPGLHERAEMQRDEEAYELDDDIVDTEIGMFDGRTVRERLSQHIGILRDFADGLDYQLQFNDHRMLDSLEREGATFIRFARTCLECERRMNSTRGSSPTTWEKGSASTMFYRTRPPRRDCNT
jgi:hypothetical protein